MMSFVLDRDVLKAGIRFEIQACPCFDCQAKRILSNESNVPTSTLIWGFALKNALKR